MKKSSGFYSLIFGLNKKRSSNQNEISKNNVSRSSSSKPYKKDGYIFNIDPEKYKDCQDFISDLKQLLRLDSEYNVFYHYIAIRKNDGQLYEVHTKVVGFVGEYVHTKAIEDFVNPPRKITFEEFVELADSKYPGISMLYEGINKNNWSLYQNVLDCWNMIPEKKRPIKKEDIDKSRVRYEFKQSYDDRHEWLRNHSNIYPLIAISEFLFNKGFIFVKASVGGGVDEISHTGDKAYTVEYMNFEDFRDNFDADLKQAKEKAKREYGGWVTSLNYRYISVELESVSSSVIVMINDGQIIINWYNIKDDSACLIEEVNDQMLNILGGNAELTREIFIK